MIDTNSKLSEPIASFVVARVAGEGYRITSSNGPFVEKVQQQVLPILEMLGPNSSANSEGNCFWLAPPGDLHNWVGIHCRVLESGNTEYRQSWFRDRRPTAKPSDGPRYNANFGGIAQQLLTSSISWEWKDDSWASMSGGNRKPPRTKTSIVLRFQFKDIASRFQYFAGKARLETGICSSAPKPYETEVVAIRSNCENAGFANRS